MKIGSLVYATDQGLGYLARSFYDHGIVTDVVVVGHRHHVNHYDWYPKSPVINILDVTRSNGAETIRRFIDGMDAMLFFETPFDWSLMDYCREQGVKTFLMPMHECTPISYKAPDVFLCPSSLDFATFSRGCVECEGDKPYTCRKHYWTPVPVATEWKQRSRVEVFVHNAGHGGLKGRNGTAELLEALRLVKSPATLILRSQDRLPLKVGSDGHAQVGNVKVIASCGTLEHKWLYDAGDCFIFPEKFNGLSLPLQEARAAGMLVMCCDRAPMNDWLPTEYLIPVRDTRQNQIGPAYLPFEETIVSPHDIAATIDRWYGQAIVDYSVKGRMWAETMSWKALGPVYQRIVESHLRPSARSVG